jgi:uncharacterized protein (DUF924 family)
MEQHREMAGIPEVSSVLDFWKEAGPERWFAKSDAFDATFRERFMGAHMAAASRKLDHWSVTAQGSLALLILLDQFPRNAFRGTAHMFATDELARYFAQHMVATGKDQEIEPDLRTFCYLPFMHAESLSFQERSVELYRALGGPSLPFAEDHHDIILRFGRFPHRNPLLGRETSADETAFIEGGGFAG